MRTPERTAEYIQYGNMAEQQNGSMAVWQNSRMAEWNDLMLMALVFCVSEECLQM